jgi:prevent-host-death family protein
MKSVEIADAAASLAAYVRGARKQPVVLTRKGKPVAVFAGLTQQS